MRAPRFILLAAICVLVAALYFASEVLIPLALAVLLSFLLSPLVVWLERRGLHRAAAVSIVVALLITVIGSLAWIVIVQVENLADQLPEYKNNIISKIRVIRGSGRGGLMSRIAPTIEEVKTAAAGPTSAPASQQAQISTTAVPINSPANPLYTQSVSEPSSLDTLGDYLGSAVGPLGTAGIVLVFVIFMLIERQDMRDRMIRLIGQGQLQLTTEALDDAASRISRYLVAQSIVNGTYGIAISLGLFIIGYTFGHAWFPSFVLWGLLCAMLRFIPYLGPWIAAAFPMAIAFAVFPGYSVFVGVVILFVTIELLSNNLMEPWLYGSSTGMSTVAILVAAVFWTWLWGPIGLLLSTPLTVCIVVIGKYVPQFQFLDILLGDEPVLEPWQRLYQRLLATDQEEAQELAATYHSKQSLEEVFDQIVLPALSMAEQDRHAGRLDDQRWMFVRSAIRDLIDELAENERIEAVRQDAEKTLRAAQDQPKEAPSESNQRSRPRLRQETRINVLCLPAHDEADEIAGIMLRELLSLRGYDATSLSHNALASEMMDEVEKRESHIVCVSAMPPAAVTHARYLCKRLTARFPEHSPVVGLWMYTRDLQRARTRIACSKDLALTTNLVEAVERVDRVAEPLIAQQLAAARADTTVKSPASSDVSPTGIQSIDPGKK